MYTYVAMLLMVLFVRFQVQFWVALLTNIHHVCEEGRQHTRATPSRWHVANSDVCHMNWIFTQQSFAWTSMRKQAPNTWSCHMCVSLPHQPPPHHNKFTEFCKFLLVCCAPIYHISCSCRHHLPHSICAAPFSSCMGLSPIQA